MKTHSRKITERRFVAEVPSPTTVTRLSTRSLILICSVIGVAFAISILVAIFFCSYWRRKVLANKGKPTFGHLNGPRTFTFKELSKATRNFHESAILGSGGSGAVYKGTLSPSGMVVAVKRLRHKSPHGEKAFLAEASTVSRIRHRNLLQLQGWCHEGHFLLVYDYMSNGSLDEWLFPARRRYPHDPKYKKFEVLPWALRSSILAGVAAALEYLHEDWVQCVLHRDIKSSNVMLDADLNPHLGDFGLARLMDHEKLEKTTLVAGTLGYMAPEIPYTGKATKESDVYSFGILVLEVVCGRRPLNLQAEVPDEDFVLLQSVWRAHEAGNILSAVDSRFLNQQKDPNCSLFTTNQNTQAIHSSSEIEQGDESSHKTSLVDMEIGDSPELVEEKKIIHLLHLGLLCCWPDPEARPSMRVVRQVIMQQQGQSSVTTSNLVPALPSSRPLGRYTLLGFDSPSMTSSFMTSSSMTSVERQLQAD